MIKFSTMKVIKLWISSDNKKIIANINQVKFVTREDNKVNVFYDDNNIFVTEFDSVEKAVKFMNKFKAFWGAQTCDEFMESF